MRSEPPIGFNSISEYQAKWEEMTFLGGPLKSEDTNLCIYLKQNSHMPYTPLADLLGMSGYTSPKGKELTADHVRKFMQKLGLTIKPMYAWLSKPKKKRANSSVRAARKRTR